MIGSANPDPRKQPALTYWVVAVLSLIWNSIGCTDFVMTVTRNSGYIAPFAPDVIDWLDSIPAWAIATWAVGVWSALGGALLLLVRSRWAVHAFALSLAGLAINQAWQLSADKPESMTTSGNSAIMIAIWIVTGGELFYALRMADKRILR